MDTDTQHYLIFVWGDVEPMLRGPYKSDESRYRAARRLRRAEGNEHGYYMLDIVGGKPRIGAFSGADFEDIDYGDDI